MAVIERSSNSQFHIRAREKQLQRDLKFFYNVESKNPCTCSGDKQNIKTKLDKIYKDRYSGVAAAYHGRSG